MWIRFDECGNILVMSIYNIDGAFYYAYNEDIFYHPEQYIIIDNIIIRKE